MKFLRSMSRGCRPTGRATFCNLWIMQFVSHVGVCLACVPLFYLFVPRKKL
jgi:hypothetical protein